MKRSNLWDPDGPIKRSRAERHRLSADAGFSRDSFGNSAAQFANYSAQFVNYSARPFFNGIPPQPPHSFPRSRFGILGPGPFNGYAAGFNGGYIPSATYPVTYRQRPPTPPHLRRNGARDGSPFKKQSTPDAYQPPSNRRVVAKNDGAKKVEITVDRDEIIIEDDDDGETNGTSKREDAFPKLTKSIMDYVRTDGQTDDMLNTKFRLRGQLEQHLRRLFSNCDLYLFGSSASGFGSMTSDMDMCLVTNNNIHIKDVKLLYRVKSVFCSVLPLIDVQVINAKVPILKFVHQPTNIQCDLNINNSDGVRNTHMLKFFTKCDPRFVPLVLTLKRWARHHKINDASQGTLSSYALTLMALHYLQVGAKPPVLPNLIAANPDVFHPRRALQSLSFYDEIKGDFVSSNESTVGELFVGFLAYYAKEFRFDYLGISVRQARAVAKRTSKEFSKWIFIEEPYNLDNVARAVRKNFEPYIKRVIDETYDVICQTKELESVLSFTVSVDAKPRVPPPSASATAAGTSASSAESKTGESSSSKSGARSPDDGETDPTKSEVSDLYEMASRRHFQVTFDVAGETGPPHAKVFLTRCSVVLKKNGEETLISALGKGNNKKQSKVESAKEMMGLLEQKKIDVAAKESFP